jgi:putative methionine-R-sulfoxide reductase with GAF domain
MTRFPLRDIAGRLAGSADLETSIDVLLAYLHALQGDWHPSVALFNAKAEQFDHVYQHNRKRLERRNVAIGLDQLPPRLVRKFIRPSAFFNADSRRNLLEKLFQTSPGYEPDRFEGQQLAALTAPVGWRSCVVLPLNDRDELIGLIVLVSPRPSAFGPAVTSELQPVRGLASLALARRLHIAGHPTPEWRAAEDGSRRTIAVLQQRLTELQAELDRHTAVDLAAGAAPPTLARATGAARAVSADAEQEKHELARRAQSLEAQLSLASEQLNEAYAQLAETQARLDEMAQTQAIVREAFEVISGDRDAGSVTRAFVAWFCERFQVGRCSLMRLDEEAGDLRILAHRGMDPTVAPRVRVRIGQGISGWVAHHRKPLFVGNPQDDVTMGPSGVDHYNSDSFISLPLVHRRRVVGVLNLSNKQDGAAFDRLDLDRAQLAGHVLAMTLGAGRESGQGAAAA